MPKKSRKNKTVTKLDTTAFTKDQWFGGGRRARNNRKSKKLQVKNAKKFTIPVQISPETGKIIDENLILDGDNGLKPILMQPLSASDE